MLVQCAVMRRSVDYFRVRSRATKDNTVNPETSGKLTADVIHYSGDDEKPPKKEEQNTAFVHQH
jgi:hypothetical protein